MEVERNQSETCSILELKTSFESSLLLGKQDKAAFNPRVLLASRTMLTHVATSASSFILTLLVQRDKAREGEEEEELKKKRKKNRGRARKEGGREAMAK